MSDSVKHTVASAESRPTVLIKGTIEKFACEALGVRRVLPYAEIPDTRWDAYQHSSSRDDLPRVSPMDSLFILLIRQVVCSELYPSAEKSRLDSGASNVDEGGEQIAAALTALAEVLGCSPPEFGASRAEVLDGVRRIVEGDPRYLQAFRARIDAAIVSGPTDDLGSRLESIMRFQFRKMTPESFREWSAPTHLKRAASHLARELQQKWFPSADPRLTRTVMAWAVTKP